MKHRCQGAARHSLPLALPRGPAAMEIAWLDQGFDRPRGLHSLPHSLAATEGDQEICNISYLITNMFTI